jgi:transposase
LDTQNPATAGEARRSAIMARKNYTEEFRRQAVDLYRSAPGATLRGIAADWGISRHTLQVWVHVLALIRRARRPTPRRPRDNERGGPDRRRPSWRSCGHR